MKVLKQTDVSNWAYLHTCLNCDSELKVEKSDITHRFYDGDIREPGYDAYSANCAVCSQVFNIPTTKIPKILQAELKKKVSSGSFWDR